MKNSCSNMAVLAVLFVCAVESHAGEQYQTEISVGTSRTDGTDGKWDYKLNSDSISAEVFFAPVKTTENPYVVAAFLERIGSFQFMVGDYGVKSGTSEGNGQMLAAGINYAKPDFPLAIQAMFSTSKLDYGAPINMTSKGNSYSLSVGNYFTRTLLAGIDYGSGKSDASQPGQPTFSYKSKNFGIHFSKYIDELERAKALALGGSLSSGTSDAGAGNLKNTAENFSFEYFFNRGLSAGIGIGNSSGENPGSEGRTYSAIVRYFASRRFSVIAMYDRFLNPNAGYISDNTLRITMALRL